MAEITLSEEQLEELSQRIAKRLIDAAQPQQAPRGRIERIGAGVEEYPTKVKTDTTGA